MLQKGLHVFCCVFYRTFTVADRDFQTEGGPPGYPDPEIRWGEGLKKFLVWSKNEEGWGVPRAPPLDPPQFKVMLHGTIRNDDF